MKTTSFKRELRDALQSPGLAVAAAFVLRMALLWWIHRDRDAHVFVFFPTSYENWNVASAMASGNGFSNAILGAPGPTAWVAPAYPWLIALALRIFHLDGYAATVLCLSVNCLVAALTCWPIYGVAKKIGGHGIGLASCWFWVFLPSAIIFPLEWMWDPSFSAFFLAALVFWTLELATTRSSLRWVGYGLLWAAVLLMNPALGILLPPLLLWLVIHRQKGRLQWLPQVAASVFSLLLCLVPWTARNYAEFGRLIPVKDNFGPELWLGNNPDVRRNFVAERHPQSDPEEMHLLVQLGEARYAQLKQHEAVEFIKAHPGTFARLALRRFVDTWTGLDDRSSDRWLLALHAKGFTVWMTSSLSLLAFAGLCLVWQGFGWEAAPIWMIPIVFPITYYVTHTSLRHRHPIDPVLVVFVVYALAHARWHLVRLQRAQPQPTPAEGN